MGPDPNKCVAISKGLLDFHIIEAIDGLASLLLLFRIVVEELSAFSQVHPRIA